MVAFLKAEMAELNRKCEAEPVIKKFVSILLCSVTHMEASEKEHEIGRHLSALVFDLIEEDIAILARDYTGDLNWPEHLNTFIDAFYYGKLTVTVVISKASGLMEARVGRPSNQTGDEKFELLIRTAVSNYILSEKFKGN